MTEFINNPNGVGFRFEEGKDTVRTPRRLTDAEIKTIHDLIDPTMPLYEGKMLFAERLQDAIFKDAT